MNRDSQYTRKTKAFFTLLLIFILLGCTAGFHRAPPAALSGGQKGKIAILPFENLSREEGAGDIAGNLFLVKMLQTGGFEIADPGYVDEALGAERVRLTAHIPLSTLQGLGKRLKVSYILMGSVLEDEMQVLSGVGGGGQVPSVSITARLIDVSSGRVIWADAQAKRGTDYEKVFGFGRIYSTSRLMEVITEKMVSSMARSIPE